MLAVGILITAAVTENGLLRKHPETRLVQDFQTKLIENEKELHRRLEDFRTKLKDSSIERFEENYYKQKQTQISETGFGFIVYKNANVVFWTDRSIAFYNTPAEFGKTRGFIQLPNGYYLVDTLSIGSFQVVGLHLIKNHYTFNA